MPRYASIDELTRAISLEILVALGLPRSGPLQTLLRPLVWLPAHRFARLASEFDRLVAESGFSAAARWALTLFAEGATAHGAEQIPASGPLLIASNHPGSYDSLLLASFAARDDLQIIVSDVPFLRGMRATSPHLIYTTLEPQARMVAFRESLRHLQAGGAVLLFASAQVDPDPALLPGAVEELQRWSPSLPLYLRRAPATRLLVSIVSGVLSPACYHHPLTRLHREQRLKQFLAEFLQVGQQVMFGRRYGLSPVVRFAPPRTAAELGGGRNSEAAMGAILAQAEMLLAQV